MQNIYETEWQNYHVSRTKRYIEYWVNYTEEKRENFVQLDRDIENIFHAFQAANDHQMYRELVRGVTSLFGYLYVRGQYKVADEYLQLAEQAARKSHEENLLADSLVQLATFAGVRGMLDRAEAYLQQVLNLIDVNAVSNQVRATFQALGTLNYVRGSYGKAESYWIKAYKVAQELGHTAAECHLGMNLGLLMHNQIKYEQAMVYLQQSIHAARSMNDSKLLEDILINDAIVRFTTGDHEGAKEVLEEVLKLSREVGHIEDQGLALNNLGQVALFQKEYDKAEELINEALKIGRQLGHPLIISGALLNLGSVACERGNYQYSEKLLKDAQQHAEEGVDVWMGLNICNTMGELYRRLEEFDKAEIMFKKVIDEAVHINSLDLKAVALLGLSKVSDAQGDAQNAYRLCQESLALLGSTQHYEVANIVDWLSQLEQNDD